MTDKINVLIIRPGERPERAVIDNTLRAEQEVVGGFIEALPLVDGTHVYCNEEGGYKGLEHNRTFLMRDISEYGDSDPAAFLSGNIIICGSDMETGEDRSLTPEQTTRWERRFSDPE